MVLQNKVLISVLWRPIKCQYANMHGNKKLVNGVYVFPNLKCYQIFYPSSTQHTDRWPITPFWKLLLYIFFFLNNLRWKLLCWTREMGLMLIAHWPKRTSKNLKRWVTVLDHFRLTPLNSPFSLILLLEMNPKMNFNMLMNMKGIHKDVSHHPPTAQTNYNLS